MGKAFVFVMAVFVLIFMGGCSGLPTHEDTFNNSGLISYKPTINGEIVGSRTDSTEKMYVTLNLVNRNSGSSERIEFMVDTGFDGWLAMPRKTARRLGVDILLGSGNAIGFDGVSRKVGVENVDFNLSGSKIDCYFVVVENDQALCVIGTRMLKNLAGFVDFQRGMATISNRPLPIVEAKNQFK